MSRSGVTFTPDRPYGSAHSYNPGIQAYNATASSFQFWRAALARQAAGGSAARLHCYGDSITWGLFQSDPLQTTAYPSKLRTLLNSWIPSFEGPIWFSNPQTGNGATVNDTRVIIGAGWLQQTGGAPYTGPGGATMLQNTTTTNSIDFGPVTCDSFTIYYLKMPSSYLFSWQIDAGAVTQIQSNSGSISVASTTVSAGAVGSHTLHIANVTGARIFAVEYDDSTRAQTGIKVSRAGNPGATSGDWCKDTDASKSLAPAFDIVSPDLTVLMLGDNDYNQNIDPAVYYSNMTAIINRARSKNGDVLLVVQPYPNAAGKAYTPTLYRQQAYALADSLNVAVLDLQDRWPLPWATANAAPFSLYSDGFHPNNKGYQDIAQAVFNVLKAVS